MGSGWDANPVAQSNPPVNVPGTRYGVYAQDKATTKFSEKNVSAVQSDLKALGYESELVEPPTNHPARYIIVLETSAGYCRVEWIIKRRNRDWGESGRRL